MTIQKLPALMERIASATEDSPIAVFRCGNSADLFDGIFSNSVAGHNRKKNNPYFIGEFYGHDYSGEIKRIILEAVYEAI